MRTMNRIDVTVRYAIDRACDDLEEAARRPYEQSRLVSYDGRTAPRDRYDVERTSLYGLAVELRASSDKEAVESLTARMPELAQMRLTRWPHVALLVARGCRHTVVDGVLCAAL